MDRRTALRALAASAAVPLLSPSELAGLIEARRALRCSEPLYRPQALDEHQIALVRTVADLILPTTDTPGATDVGVHEFVDVIVSEWFDDDEADRFTAGLAQLDHDASERFGAGFLEVGAEQQTALVTEMDTRLFELRERDSEAASDSFFHWMKRLTLTGYFTSEEGAAVIGRRIIPGQFEGCLVPEATR